MPTLHNDLLHNFKDKIVRKVEDYIDFLKASFVTKPYSATNKNRRQVIFWDLNITINIFNPWFQ